MNTELSTQHDGQALYRQSTDAANLCKAVVTQTAIQIQGRKYVRVEGWQAIAVAHGCIASADEVEWISGGCRAVGRVVSRESGIEVARSEGYVGEDEPVWYGGNVNGKQYVKRPDYAIRAMAQTRAISRACRAAFAHVVVMMNAGLETTPAEEVPDGGFQDAPPRAERVPQQAASNARGPTEKQIKRLHAIKMQSGVPDGALRTWLAERDCVDANGEPATTALSRAQYDELCDTWLPGYAAVQAGQDAHASADENPF